MEGAENEANAGTVSDPADQADSRLLGPKERKKKDR